MEFPLVALDGTDCWTPDVEEFEHVDGRVDRVRCEELFDNGLVAGPDYVAGWCCEGERVALYGVEGLVPVFPDGPDL